MIKAAIILAVVSGTTLHKYVSPQSEVSTNIEASVQSIVTKDYVEGLGVVPEVDFSTGNTQLVATIEAKAPAPGDYANVSNAAMNAVQSQSMTNYATRAELDAGWWSEWVISSSDYPNPIPSSWRVFWDDTDGWIFYFNDMLSTTTAQNFDPDAESLSCSNVEQYEPLAYYNFTATRHRVAAPVPTKPSDIGAASTNDVMLNAEYGGLWTIWKDGVEITDAVGQPLYAEVDGGWEIGASTMSSDTPTTPIVQEGENAATLSWTAHDSDYELVHYSAGRSSIGYTLGSQSDKPLQPKGDYAQASVLADIAETATNALETAGAAAAASSTNSANIATLNVQVSSIGAHLNAEDAHFVSTNYDSAVRLPEAYVEIKMRDQATGSNTWITIWQEMRRWTAFVGSAFDWQTWQGFHTWATNITQELSFKADRCWGIYNSETGEYSPEGYTQISSSNILIAAGMAYQRTVTSGGAVWILRCNQGVAQMGGDTNGFFQVFDGDGVVQFEIIKGDKREMGADATGITVGSGSPPVVTIPYSVEAAEHPTIYVCDNLSSANWKSETDPDCIANVSWSGVSGSYVASVQRKTSGSALFVKATFMAGGETYIRNVAPVGMDSIILNGVRYYLGTATISGNTVLTLSTTAP